MLHLLNQAPELKGITYAGPASTKTADDIPGPWVFDALYIASPPHPRNKAFFAMWRENPNRIGGLGSLQCKNFHHDDLGYKVTISDKTFNGEPVRFVESQADISRYIEWLKANNLWKPENPFWINFAKLRAGKVLPLSYVSFRRLILKTKEKHNKLAKTNPSLKPITLRITTHIARYTKTIVYRKQKKDPWFIEKQMGWVPGSGRLSYYSKFDTSDIDEVFREELGLTNKELPVRCPRCLKESPPGSEFCRFCRSPLSLEIASKMEETEKLKESIDVKYIRALEERLKRLEKSK